MTENIKLGLKENWKKFTILVIVNSFVGGMIGMERTIFPQFAELEFGVASKTAILSFITAFGITKAIANYYTGDLPINSDAEIYFCLVGCSQFQFLLCSYMLPVGVG